VDKPPNDCGQAVKNLERSLKGALVEITERFSDPEGGGGFIEASQGDAPVVEPVLSDAPAAFTQIERHRCESPTHLPCKVGITGPQTSKGIAERADGLEAQF
jgi:hypothetical protein